VVSEEKIFEKVYRRTDDGRQMMAIAHTGELKIMLIDQKLRALSR